MCLRDEKLFSTKTLIIDGMVKIKESNLYTSGITSFKRSISKTTITS
jgi:hypothetical protein